jgi:hypothetical protein
LSHRCAIPASVPGPVRPSAAGLRARPLRGRRRAQSVHALSTTAGRALPAQRAYTHVRCVPLHKLVISWGSLRGRPARRQKEARWVQHGQLVRVAAPSLSPATRVRSLLRSAPPHWLREATASNSKGADAQRRASSVCVSPDVSPTGNTVACLGHTASSSSTHPPSPPVATGAPAPRRRLLTRGRCCRASRRVRRRRHRPARAAARLWQRRQPAGNLQVAPQKECASALSGLG